MSWVFMELESLIEGISFAGIVPGSYSTLERPVIASAALTENNDQENYSTELFAFSRSRAFSISSTGEKDDSESASQDKLLSKGQEPLQRYLGSAVRRRVSSFLPRASAVSAEHYKPNDVLALETFLRAAYKAPDIVITRVEALPMTRKEVRRVFFALRDNLYQVWAFKANPQTTGRELTASTIAFNHGIPTGKPLGFDLSRHAQLYPYDIALLGGILEHAGDSYEQLLGNLALEPGYMFSTAQHVARILANFHVKLSEVQEEFGQHGLVLQRASPRREITSRLLPVLKIPEENPIAERFIRACEDLYDEQRGDLVVSHGDINTGNVVTISESGLHHQSRTSLYKFGVIDFESIGLDYPQGDLADFWLHHQRKAVAICPNYDYSFDEFVRAYHVALTRLVQHHDFVSTSFYNSKSALIQRTLWNVYELFDPTRKGPAIMKKADFHYRALHDVLPFLKEYGLSDRGKIILRESQQLLKTTPYYASLLKSL